MIQVLSLHNALCIILNLFNPVPNSMTTDFLTIDQSFA